jgi:alkylation response protein AidB-like acyl-CoA dehydrogenase
VDFRLTDEHLEFQRHCHAFARDVMRPAARYYDREQSVPYDIVREARRRGLHGLDLLQRIGSDPHGMLMVIYAEELHWGCAGIALAISASSLAAAGIAASGTPEQIARWVPECYGLGEEIKFGAYAVTEAGAGSDVRSLRTTARREDEEWVLNGTKVFISNGGIADVTVVVATVDPKLGHRGQASFVVPKGTPGLSMGKKEDKLGIRASQTAEVVLEDVRIPLDHLLGGLEKLEAKLERARSGQRSGSSNALATFEVTRPAVGASALGIARAAYEWTLDYLEGRSDEGGPLLEQERVQQVLADVATEIDAARMLVWRAAWMGRNGIPMTGGQGSMSKLKAGDVAMWATTTLMDLVGPAASLTDHPLEKWFRDAKIYQLFEGTAEIQRLVVARMQTAARRAQREAEAESAPATETAGATETAPEAETAGATETAGASASENGRVTEPVTPLATAATRER